MSTSRREFLKTTMIAGASVALEALPASASPRGGVKKMPAVVPAVSGAVASAPGYTRGTGIYPGAPEEDFSPILLPDNSSTYRNLALLRPAYHSSAYDYNLTAQLVTNGIAETRVPEWIAVSTNSRESMPKPERESIVDHFLSNALEVRGESPWAQIQLGGEITPESDRIDLAVVVPYQEIENKFRFTVMVSDDDRTWTEAGSAISGKPASVGSYPPDLADPGQLFLTSVPLKRSYKCRYYRIALSLINAARPTVEELKWQLCEAAFYHNDRRVQIGGPYHFTSAWMSAGLGEEWIYVDLGSRCEFDRVQLHWIARAAEGSLQISDDAETWRDLQPLPGGTDPVDDIRLVQPAQARYLRVLMTKTATPAGYILSEIEVYGRGGFVAQPKPSPANSERLILAGGNWRLQRSSQVAADGEALSKHGFKDESWIVATVPGTVLTSYLNVGAIPDPNFGENQLYISDSFFYSDFWYRTEFLSPAIADGEVAWLNFNGINWKAEVYLNGQKLGRIEGGFQRGRFDVTGNLLRGQTNALAVRIEKNATPGSVHQKTFEKAGNNGGAPGADNPTYHASVGWDWIPTIRGRNTGIWSEVSIAVTGAVTIENPFVSSKLSKDGAAKADVNIETVLENHRAQPISGILRGHFGDVAFEQRITVDGLARKTVTLNPQTHAALRLENPKLWWPVGYGDPYLYDVKLSFVADGEKQLDAKQFKAGVRQMSYSEEGGALKIWINGRRFIPRGGNWGFSESMLRYRGREYDAALRYHREMNFTMIRNWVGQIGDDEFYEACDRHGVMVWQDFWLANPGDGPNPDDHALFLRNAKDVVLRIRNHASVGLYCGRNEGYPPEPLEEGL